MATITTAIKEYGDVVRVAAECIVAISTLLLRTNESVSDSPLRKVGIFLQAASSMTTSVWQGQ